MWEGLGVSGQRMKAALGGAVGIRPEDESCLGRGRGLFVTSWEGSGQGLPGLAGDHRWRDGR